jgi:hypothetical protein
MSDMKIEWVPLGYNALMVGASVVMMQAFHKFHHETNSKETVHYYQGYETLGTSVRKYAEIGETFAIMSIIASAVLFVVSFIKKESLPDGTWFGHVLTLLQYGLIVPTVFFLFTICTGFKPENNVYKQHVTYGGPGSDLPSLQEDTEVMTHFIIANTLIIVATAVGSTIMIEGDHRAPHKDLMAKLHKFLYAVGILLLIIGCVFIASVRVHVAKTCDIDKHESNHYLWTRDMAIPLMIFLFLELGYMGAALAGVYKDAHQEKNGMHYGTSVFFLLKYLGMMSVLGSFALSSTKFPCLIENKDAVTGGEFFGFGMLLLFVAALTSITQKYFSNKAGSSYRYGR